MSEEKNQILQEQSSTQASFANFEAQVLARANELLAQRVAPLKAEIERLQTNITEISSRLSEQEGALDEVESSGLLDSIKKWFSDSTAKAEEDFKTRFEEARAEAEAATAALAEIERDFQSRMEQSCAEAAAVARRESETQIEDLREQLEASRKALTMAVAPSPAPPSQTTNYDTLKAAIEDIDSQRTQSEALAALVRRAAHFAPRVVFFVIKSGEAVGWKASGFENGLNDETIKLLTVSSHKQTFLRDALTGFRLATSDGGDSSSALGLYSSPVPERAIAIPLIVFNKAVALLYADSGTQSESMINTAALESLTRIAGKTIESLLPRRSAEPARPTPAQPQASPLTRETALAASFSAEGGAEIRAESAAVQPAVQVDKPWIETGLKQEFGRENQAAELRSFATEAAPRTGQIAEAAPKTIDGKHRTEDLPPLAGQAAEIDEGLRQAEAQLPEPAYIETEPSAPAIEPRRITREVGETVTAVDEDTASASTAQISDFIVPPIEDRTAVSGASAFSAPPTFAPPPPPPRPAAPVTPVPTPGSETEQRAHNDARRFARLLVSEIKLYNAAKVNDGRRNFDLYDRLKDEIDRSRKVYDKRVSPAVAARFDYFYDELVQTLAEGDPSKLGKNCPGPVVLA